METQLSTQPLARNPKPQPRDLQVSGLQIFTEDRWRDCILHFLFGVWSDDRNVTHRPKIQLGEITLRLIQATGEYVAYGDSLEPEHPSFTEDETLVVSGSQLGVEMGLVRFVKNDRLKLLVIVLPRGAEVRLWKKLWRSRFGISATGIPRR